HTAVDLHIRLIHSTVARPQGRGKIERFFGTINTELLATLPGHITEGHPWPTPKLSLAELDSALEAFVATYNDRTHSELGTSPRSARSEEHTSELQSRFDLVCRLLLEKNKH